MQPSVKTAALAILLAMSLASPGLAASPPEWAYPVGPSAAAGMDEMAGRFAALNVRGDDHPPMPAIVAVGRAPDVPACGFCHGAAGLGGPQNGALAGLTAPYMTSQVEVFRRLARQSAEPGRALLGAPSHGGAAITDDEIAEAVAYYAGLKFVSTVDVVEAGEVPKTRSQGGGLMLAPEGGTEGIGARIIEVPSGQVRTTAYVPPGSVEKGRALAEDGDDGRLAICSNCHGVALKGTRLAPGIAGRSPSAIVRQLFDLRAGTRKGANAVAMKGSVAPMTDDDMLVLAAFISSLKQ